MRKISANYIFDGIGKFYKNGILHIDDTGKIVKLVDTKGELHEENQLEYYNGVITPGFINAHCHIELSSLKGKLSQKKGLPSFISEIVSLKQNLEKQAIEKADRLMQNNGIVAVGDISNSEISFEIKQQSKIKYHTFIELISPDNNKAYDALGYGKTLKNKADKYNLKASLVPHATYSVSQKILQLISEIAFNENSIISFHNQETESENQMFIEAKGELLDTLKKINGFYQNFKPTFFNSLPSTLVHLPKCNKTILVHNTCTNKKDIQWVKDYTSHAFWCLCPNANIYIEDKLPDINLLKSSDIKICLGTDSLASNTNLSILDEMKTISKNFDIDLAELLKWATINGAEALDLQFEIGSFGEGKTPGVNLIENVDLKNLKLKKDSFVKVLL